MINLTIDGQQVTVEKGTTVYHAAQKLGIDIPIFCYQDRMPPFGACRMCLVQVEKAEKLQASCTLECTEGMNVSTQSETAVDGRKGILELLLINHPLDCPICDKGGECPLQDQTLEHGPEESRFYEVKRQFKKPIALGPVLELDRERCIICARCTRFSDLISGDHALEFIDRGFKSEVGTSDNQVSKSKFIGNTISLCPVGALTSQVYRFRARPWDNQTTESTCTLCPIGCSMAFDERDGEIMRTRVVENRAVNDVWLCDKGWFGYQFAESSERLQTPLVRKGSTLIPISWDEALNLIVEKMESAKPSGKIAAFGGAPLTTEENYLLQKLMREGLGTNHVDYRVGVPAFSLDEEIISPGMEMEIGECEELGFALLLGVDLTEEFPLLWLRIKQAINRGCKVVFAGHYAPEIAQHLSEIVLHAPGEEIRVLNEKQSQWIELAKQQQKSAIFVGRQYLANSSRRAISEQLLNLQQQVPNLKINVLEGQGNSFGARFAGMHPELSPMNERSQSPGLNALQWVEEAASKGWDFLYVVGADPALKFPVEKWKQAKEKLEFLVVQDLFLTETAQEADLVLPALCYMEKKGSFTNISGVMQPLLPGKVLPGGVYSDAEIFTLIANKLGMPIELGADFYDAISSGRIKREKSNSSKTNEQQNNSESNSGKLKVSLAPALFDEGVRMRRNHHLLRLAKHPMARIHPAEGQQRQLNDGSLVQITANGKSISIPIAYDLSVAKGTVVLPLGYPIVPISTLSPNYLNGIEVDIT